MRKVNPLFRVHRLNPAGMQHAERIALAFDRLLTELAPSCPDGRDFALVKTKLQEACFFAKRAMAEKPEHQESDQ